MASRHFSGDKAPKGEAEKKMREYVVGVFDGRFFVKFDSDDGGTLLNVYVEVEDVSSTLDGIMHDAFRDTKWMGWRYVVTKCPIGYIDAILTAPEPKDY